MIDPNRILRLRARMVLARVSLKQLCKKAGLPYNPVRVQMQHGQMSEGRMQLLEKTLNQM